MLLPAELPSFHDIESAVTSWSTPSLARASHLDAPKGGVYVDEGDCVGCMQCVHVARNTFAVTQDGKARAICQDFDCAETVCEAIDCCPVDCIYVLELEDLRRAEVARDAQAGA